MCSLLLLPLFIWVRQGWSTGPLMLAAFFLMAAHARQSTEGRSPAALASMLERPMEYVQFVAVALEDASPQAAQPGRAAWLALLKAGALDVFGERAPVQLEAGEFFLAQKNYREAQSALLKAQALDPENPMVLLELARASSALEEYDTAVVSLRKLVQLEPGNAEALWALAETYGEKLGMTGKGAAAYRDFERLFPSDSRAG